MKACFNAIGFIVTLLFLQQPLITFAQGARDVETDNRLANAVDTAVQRVMSRFTSQSNMVGVSIGVYYSGQQYTYNYGEVKKGSSILPAADNLYDIGSVAKVFVTTMLAKAVVDKKVKLEDDIRKYLPGKYPNLAYKGHPVTLQHLANHTSGLPELSREYSASLIDSVLKLTPAGLENFYAVYTADSLLRDMHHFTVDTLPGVKYRYNGNAMEVLLLLLERIYRQPYEKLVTDFLQSRFGMSDTRITIPPSAQQRLAPGYDENGQPQPYVNFNGYRAAPGINSTVSDMLQFIKANVAEVDPVIRLSHQATFSRSDSTAIGLGWMIERQKENGGSMIYHSGRGSGITTLCSIHPGKKAGFIIMANGGQSEGQLFELEDKLLKELDQH